MKKIDFIIQTILMSLALLLLIGGIVINPACFWFIAILQFFIGLYQLISAIISLFFKAKRNIMLLIYWGLVIVYFISYFLIQNNYASYAYENQPPFDSKYLDNIYSYIIVWFISAWTIVVYYYVVITISMFKKQEKKTYLDIAN